MRIRFYKVACGDAASIRYIGDDGVLHCIFIDAGYERTYRDILANEIKAIEHSGSKIDLWIVSHIHDDHIGGAISYLKAIEKGEANDIVLRWWYNQPSDVVHNLPASERRAIGIGEAKSFVQGDKLASYLVRAGHLSQPDVVQGNTLNIAGLKITVLSPITSVLEKLREKYKSTGVQSLNHHGLTVISEPKATTASDYRKRVEDFDLNSFAEDTSIENNSSIAVLIEWNERKLLWLADAWPSTIVSALKNLGYSKENLLKVDLVKVSHHGSSGNNSNELYSIIYCDKYIFCADGDNKHKLPNKECLVRILKNTQRSEKSFYRFLFTGDNETVRSMFSVDGEDVHQRMRFDVEFENSKWLEVHLS
jgi:beta-lactamase superfamily II metal-dependent hydrolase